MNKLSYIFILLCIIIASWFVFDLSRYLPPDLIFQRGVKYESKDVQDRVAQELKKNDIPHRIRSDGFIEYREKDHKKVREIADKIKSKDSGHSNILPEIHVILDKCHELLLVNKFDEALAILNEGISKNKNTAILFNFRGLVWSFKGEVDKAIADYTAAIGLAPKYQEAYSNRAAAWARKDELKKAIEDYNLALNISPKDTSDIFYRGSTYSELGDYEKAFSDFKNAIKLDTKWAEESFKKESIIYSQSELSKSKLYLELEPLWVSWNRRIRN